MKIEKFLMCLLGSIFLIVFVACNNDESSPNTPDPIEDSDTDDDDDLPEDTTENDTGTTDLGSFEFFNRDAAEDGYILVNDAGNNRAYIMDKEANLVHEWALSNNIGNDVFLLSNGKLLASLEADEPKIKFGGQGGKVQFIDKDGTIEWNFNYSSEDYESHHDAELLPNGNIIAMVWEKKTAEEAIAAGYQMEIDLYPEAIIEIDPATDEIVWEWHAWDHLVQDFDDTKENFGSIADNPQLIDLNYVQIENGDIMHGNAIEYDEINDHIYISSNFYHEVWVIDHSATTEESASHTGGNSNKGGDLVYRFGNPEAYDNSFGERLFYNNHFPNFTGNHGTSDRNMLIFVNRMNDTEQSVVYELQLPSTFDLKAGVNNEPAVVWSFTDKDLFSPKVSGAVRLDNGNTLITEGDFGFWEVTGKGEVVWKFEGDGFFWRGYDFPKDAPEIIALGL